MSDQSKRRVVAMIVMDDREVWRRYDDPEPYFGPAPQMLVRGLAEIDACEVHTICCVQRAVRSPERLYDKVRHHTLVVPKVGWLRGAYLGCVRAVRQKLREIQPDVVHGQGTERYCSLAASRSGFPNVMTIHGNMRRIAQINRARPFSFDWLTARFEFLALRATGGVICISSHTRREVEGLAARTWIVPNAIHPDFFAWENEGGGGRTVLCVATICLVKNQVALIRALDPVAERLGLRLIFLGRVDPGSAYGREFLELVERRNWCEFPGHADRPALMKQLAKTDLLVLPSLEDNCPLVVLEAQAAGVPVVAGRVGGIPDLIRDGETGRLCDPSDPESIRNCVEDVLTDPAGRNRLRERARERAERTYRPAAVARRHVEIYEEMADRER